MLHFLSQRFRVSLNDMSRPEWGPGRNVSAKIHKGGFTPGDGMLVKKTNNRMPCFNLAALTLVALTNTVLPASAQAAGFYLGADVVTLSTELDYQPKENYSTTHLRVKSGYAFSDILAFEIHVTGAGDDSSIDPYDNLYKFDIRNTLGIYVKPRTNVGKANVYGLVGFSSWDTAYTKIIPPGTREKDSAVMFGAGLGGEFNITDNLRFNIEGMLHRGTLYYPDNLSVIAEVYATGISAGVSYHF